MRSYSFDEDAHSIAAYSFGGDDAWPFVTALCFCAVVLMLSPGAGKRLRVGVLESDRPSTKFVAPWMLEDTAQLGAVDGFLATILRDMGADPIIVFLTHEIQQPTHVAAIDGGDPVQVPNSTEIQLHARTPGRARVHVDVVDRKGQRVVQTGLENMPPVQA